MTLWATLDVDHNLVPCDLEEWVAWEEENESRCVVGSAQIADRWVSTRFLGLLIQSGGPFETCIFGGPDARYVVERYQTWDDAAIGHEKWATSIWKELNG